MSDAPVQTQVGLEAQPPMQVRRLHNFIYCPRLFYFQWVENSFQENADTVAGSLFPVASKRWTICEQKGLAKLCA